MYTERCWSFVNLVFEICNTFCVLAKQTEHAHINILSKQANAANNRQTEIPPQLRCLLAPVCSFGGIMSRDAHLL